MYVAKAYAKSEKRYIFMKMRAAVIGLLGVAWAEAWHLGFAHSLLRRRNSMAARIIASGICVNSGETMVNVRRRRRAMARLGAKTCAP